jgi:A/G-specific adenine glycosylase
MAKNAPPPESQLILADVDSVRIDTVRAALLTWFAANRRDLPWRHSRDPYRILVSEVMLQQTQVDRVLPYYQAFLERFPDAEALAAAPTAEVIRLWAGLGYNRRAVNLQRTAQYVVEHLGGVFPSDVESLKKLPGIGPYTAGAIACFAFEQDVAFVDTNIRRVLHRIFVGVDVPAPTASERAIVAIGEAAVPSGNGWMWNQAIMEFGALQCTARKPACVICPMQSVCRAFPTILSALGELPRGVRLKREAPFTGSNRFYRGRVLDALREHSSDGISMTELGARVRDNFGESDLPWLYEVVQGLQRDGLAMVAEDTPTYDVDEDEPPLGDQRVKLP